MKTLTSVISISLAFAAACAAERTGSIVRFSNNDRLVGNIESLSSDLLVWKSPAFDKPAAFFLKDVVDMVLPGTMPPTDADHEAVLSLTNGDTIRGQLASVTENKVSIDTAFAGRMNFNRVNVSGLRILQQSAITYRGPSGLDGWRFTDNKPSWVFDRAAFRCVAAGGIGRGDLLPDECSIAFDVSWKGTALGMRVVVFSDNLNTADSESGYDFTLQPGAIYVRNCKSSMPLGNARAQDLMENEKVRVEIRASAKTGKLSLLINDKTIENWTDTDFKKGRFGRGLQFVSQSNAPLRISAISVATWDGVLGELADPAQGMVFRGFGGGGLGGVRMNGRDAQDAESKPETKEPCKDGRMELANGDSVAGEVTSIKDGSIEIKSPLGDVKLPITRLRNITLKPSPTGLETGKLLNGDIRAWLPDGSSLVFRLDAVAGDGTLTGYSQNFGTATFKLGAFNRLEFNIHDPELEDKRTTDEW